ITCNSRKVVLIDPVDWVIEWQSPETTNYGDGFYKADVGNIDSDAAPEMIFLHSNVLTVFDGITHAATEIGRTDITSFAFYDKNNDGISELYIGTLNGKVGMITVDSVNWTGIVTGKRINDLNVVDLLSAPGEEFIFMSDGRLWTSSQEGKSQCSKTISDVASMYDCIELTDYNEDGKTEIFAGTSYMVSEMSYECYKCAAMDINLQAGHLTCGHGNDGSVASIVNNAIAPITYAWNNGLTSQDLSGLAAGTYTVTATDGVGCEDVDSIKVEQLYLQAYIHATRKGCTDAFPGEIATEIIVGQPPYTYHWNNGSADPSLINPPDGEYTVLITDANNCTRQLSAPMIKDTLILDAKIMQINCHDGGSIEIMASGYPPYTYNWSDGYHQPSRIEPEPGNYSITVNDMYGCTATKEILFEQYTELGANVFSFCDNPNTPEYDGAVLLEPFGGAPPYTINWSIIPEPVNPLRVTGLIPDEYYSFSITDAANCQYNDYVEVTNGMLFREGKAYPNPAHDFVTIDLSENFIPFKKATADFYNINGVKELSVNLSSPITVVDLMHLGSGLYIVKINIDGIDTMLKMERIKHKKKE
ncbi:MAG: T9SS type A sorting domain-containing protein, partial [Chloroflexota bacterium]